MANLTTRSLTVSTVSTDNLNKGSALTIAEMDSNFLNLNTDKLDSANGTVTGDLTVTSATSSAVGSIKLLEAADNGTESITIKAPTALAANLDFILPSTAGTSGYALTTDGAGTLSWAAAGGGSGDITRVNITAGTGLSGTQDTLTGDHTQTLTIDTSVTADLSTAQTLINKTLTSPVISSISNTGTLTLPTSTDTLTGRDTTDTLTNKSIDADTNTITNLETDNIKAGTLVIESEGIGSNDNDTTIPTSAAVKDYVDTTVNATNELVEDTTPQLGGDLDVNGQKLVTTSNGNIILEPNGTGEIRIDSDVVEQYSTKGHIITNYGQGSSPDLTSQGADFGTVYGKGIDIQADGSYAALDMWSHKSNTGYPNIWAHRSRDDGAGNKDYLDNGDRVFNFLGSGWGGGADTPANFYGAFAPVGEFILIANEDHSATARGGKWQFRTTSTGSTSGSTKMEIGDDINALTAIKLDEVSAPATETDKGFIYAKDVSGTAEVFVKDAAGNETQISPHNEQGEWEYFSRNVKTGKTVRINMEEMIRDIEQLTGKTYIKDE